MARARLSIADTPPGTSCPPAAVPVRSPVPMWEQAFVVLAALLYWTDLLRIIFPGTDGVSVAFRLTHFAFYGAFLALLLRDLPGLGRTLAAAPALVLLLCLPLASTQWSVQPQETLQRAIALLGSSLFAIYLATRLPPRLVLRLLALTGLLATVSSFFLIAFVPSVGLMSEGVYVEVWSGAYIHKNGMGQGAMLGALICLILLMTDGLRRNVWLLIGLVLSALLLAGSRSLTAQVVFVASVLLLVTIGPFVRVLVDHAVWLGLLLAPLLLLAVTSLSVDDLFEWLSLAGKDATMSSRLPLWQLLQPFLADRFWLGHGYEAFWGEGHHALRVIEAKLYFKPHYAHNGYIELWLGLGAAGFALTAAVFIAFAVRAVRRLYADQRDPAWLLALVYVPMFLIQNIAEATILQRNSMNWVLFVWLALVLAIAARQRRAPQADASDPSDRALVSARRRPLAVH